jgi:nucleotide-binding universal stress UspA family protein
MRARGIGPADVVPAPDRPDPERIAFETARSMATEVTDELLGETGIRVPVDVEAVAGQPVDVLVDVARGADELVVGSRGRNAAASALLGSVSLGCVLHARCPVTVVPDRAEAADRAKTQPGAPRER